MPRSYQHISNYEKNIKIESTSFQQNRMRNCEPNTEVSKETLNPYYYLNYH